MQFHAILTDSKFLFEADAAALIEHMVGEVGDTVGASWRAHCAATLWSCPFPSASSGGSHCAHFLVRPNLTLYRNYYRVFRWFPADFDVHRHRCAIGLAIFSVNIHGNLRQQVTIFRENFHGKQQLTIFREYSRQSTATTHYFPWKFWLVIEANIRQVSLVSRFVTVTE